MVTEKIKNTSELMRQLLTIMAFSRSTMNIEAMYELLSSHGKRDVSIGSLVEELDQATENGLLSNNIGSPTYSFAHDKVQEAGTYSSIHHTNWYVFHQSVR